MPDLSSYLHVIGYCDTLHNSDYNCIHAIRKRNQDIIGEGLTVAFLWHFSPRMYMRAISGQFVYSWFCIAEHPLTWIQEAFARVESDREWNKTYETVADAYATYLSLYKLLTVEERMRLLCGPALKQ